MTASASEHPSLLTSELFEQLAGVAMRLERFRLWVALAVCWLVASLTGGGLLAAAIYHGWWSWVTIPALLGATLLVSLLCAALAHRSASDAHAVARRIERCYPSLAARLLAAVEQQPEAPSFRLSFLQETVIAEALQHAREFPWPETIPQRRLLLAYLAHLGSFSLLAAVLTGLLVFQPSRRELQGQGAASVASGKGLFTLPTVEPGDIELERGSSLLVLARFEPPARPADVRLVVQPAGGQRQQVPLTRSLDEGVFGGRVRIAEASSYRVEFAGAETRWFQVRVFDYPAMVRADVRLEYPSYTDWPATLVEDTLQATAVEGTLLHLRCHLNKPARRAWLESETGETVELAAGEAPAVNLPGSATATATLRLAATVRYTLRLEDDAGRRNRQAPQFTFTAVPNRRPELKLAFPGRDLQVSPLQELALQATAWDDFGLKACGVAFQRPGQAEQTITATRDVVTSQPLVVEQVLPLEDLRAQPDELLSYYLWADDLGPDGQIRRTCSDIYFAEVRPFEEIYRPGQQPPVNQRSSGSGQGEQAEKLADLQKQIIIATWNLIRREAGPAPGERFVPDIRLVHESQTTARQQADELAEKLTDRRSKEFAAEAQSQMDAAIEQLQAAAAGPSLTPLHPALAAEQAAYQALLRLRSREHEVIRGASGGGGGSGQRSDEQLQQLDLTNSENRYETQRTADTPADAAAREQRQIHNRLQELARRQADVNERLKELQSALALAEEAQRAQAQRQLQRLREEQQELLHEVDELRGRMNQGESQSRHADARQQLERTRSHIRQASEALRQGQVSRALTSGTRAGQELQTLRDEFRRRTANRFADDARRLRDQARELSQRQSTLGEELDQLRAGRATRLRDDQRRERLHSGLAEQNQRLEELLRGMRQVVQEAEIPEPLLARTLYEAARQAQQDRIGQGLQQTGDALRQGQLDQAAQAERQVRPALERLSAATQRAAETILGNESESLRRAGQELQQLAQQLREEISQADRSPSDEGATRRLANRSENPGPAAQPPPANSPSGSDSQPAPARPAAAEPSPSEIAASGNGAPESPDGTPGRGSDASSRTASAGLRAGPPRSGPPRGQPSGGSGGGSQEAPWSGVLRLAENSGGPLTGEAFRQWSDRLRDVEEMLEDPQLRGDVAAIRDRARQLRSEFKRHSREPDWNLVRATVLEPLVELADKLAAEARRKDGTDPLVPLDRQLVPPRFEDLVRKYFERLGKGK